jgi:tRNA (mo5U34)-methyltransferase
MSPLALLPRSRRERRLRQRVASVPSWWHEIELGHGVVTPGRKGGGHGYMEEELERLRLPSLAGRSVLDVGAWDGFFSFAAERLGAARVVALDHYVWGLDPGRPGAPLDLEGTPGKAGFDLAHEELDSRVEARVADFMEIDLAELGVFDVVLFLGVLYHLQDPLGAMRRLARLTGELAVIETEAVSFPANEDRPLWEFFADDELAGDPTNWWVPSIRALEDVCGASGFRRVDVLQGPPVQAGPGPYRYRAIVHAWK